LKIYTYPKSRSLRVLWTLEEIGIAYEPIKVDLLSQNPEVKSPHPYGKVPFLIDEHVSISETLAICIYICEKKPETPLYPTSPKAKALVNSRLSFALTDLESPVWRLLKQLVFTPENQRSPDLIRSLKQEATKVVSQISLVPHHTWIAGNSFTLADIFMSHTLLWAKFCGIEIGKEIENYLSRALNRPAFLAAQEKNNS